MDVRADGSSGIRTPQSGEAMHPLDGPLELKLFDETEGDGEGTLPSLSRDVVPVFHRWLQDQRLPGELLIDVADYSHVTGGPAWFSWDRILGTAWTTPRGFPGSPRD